MFEERLLSKVLHKRSNNRLTHA